MKALRNPLVVGALAFVALALLLWRVVLPLVRPYFGRQKTVQQIVSDVGDKLVSEALPNSTPTPPPVAAEVETRIEVPNIFTNIAEWVAVPKRDPFQGRIRPRDDRGAYPPAAELLTLTGIWRQTGSSLAVINGQILSEGSDILDFKVAAIETDRVWVQGPNGREALSFLPPGAGTNRPPAAAQPPSPRSP
jgi:hypothetical protein